MIVINKAYLELFYKSKNEYMYKVANGIYLAFKSSNLEYIGVEYFYLPFDYKSYQKDCDATLERLINKGICEII